MHIVLHLTSHAFLLVHWVQIALANTVSEWILLLLHAAAMRDWSSLIIQPRTMVRCFVFLAALCIVSMVGAFRASTAQNRWISRPMVAVKYQRGDLSCHLVCCCMYENVPLLLTLFYTIHSQSKMSLRSPLTMVCLEKRTTTLISTLHY